ncbi:hypothetical protein GCM10027519_31860 [Kineococcus endophyticus]
MGDPQGRRGPRAPLAEQPVGVRVGGGGGTDRPCQPVSAERGVGEDRQVRHHRTAGHGPALVAGRGGGDAVAQDDEGGGRRVRESALVDVGRGARPEQGVDRSVGVDLLGRRRGRGPVEVGEVRRAEDLGRDAARVSRRSVRQSPCAAGVGCGAQVPVADGHDPAPPRWAGSRHLGDEGTQDGTVVEGGARAGETGPERQHAVDRSLHGASIACTGVRDQLDDLLSEALH